MRGVKLKKIPQIMVVELHHQFAHHIWLCHILLFLVLLRFQNSLRRTLDRSVWSKNGNHCLWGKAESDRVQSSSSFSRLGNSPSCCGAWCLYTSGGETKRLCSEQKMRPLFYKEIDPLMFEDFCGKFSMKRWRWFHLDLPPWRRRSPRWALFLTRLWR